MRRLLDWQLLHQIRVSEYFIFLKTLTKSQLNLTTLECSLFQSVLSEHKNLTIDQVIMFFLITTVEPHNSQPEHS